ncbi:MAG: hypothetical protein JWR61_1645 [Ferruginibacter sp.]|nr:hypothetical protein [Ferruginibacter sp.]
MLLQRQSLNYTKQAFSILILYKILCQPYGAGMQININKE